MRIWFHENIITEAKKYDTRVSFRLGSRGAYNAALRLDIIDEVCSHMIKKSWSIWYYDNILFEALKYKFRVDFQDGSKGAYKAAVRQGILDEVCSHMEEKRNFWRHKGILEEAKKHLTRYGFAKSAKGAYSAAKRLGILDEVCSHMIPLQTHLYFMKISGEKNLWKVGVTKDFETRFRDLTRKMPFEKFSSKYISETAKCDMYEKEILSMGKKRVFEKYFVNSTEFKLYDDDVVDKILEKYFGVDKYQKVIV